MKKTLAILLSVALILTSLPFAIISSADGSNANQIVSVGGSSITDDGRIEVSKTVSSTDTENYFDINLSVKQEIFSTDVVIVMDISNTMNSNHNGKPTNNVDEKRITKAKNAAKAFLDEYSKTTTICKNRRIGMVQFNSNASVVFSLGNVNDNLSTYTQKISSLEAPSENKIKFTNIEGGLQLAANMLESSTAEQKYIILITDGFPTTYIEGDRNSTSSLKGWDVYRTPSKPVPSKPSDGVFWDFVKGMNCIGTSYSDTAAVKARETATRIKDSGINIYSIGVDVSSESQTIQKYIDQGAEGGYSVVERISEEYEVGSATDSSAYVNWLGKKIGGGEDLKKAGVTNAFSQGDTVAQLEHAFDTILNYILGSEPKAVTDPMGKNIEFIGFYDKNGALVSDKLSGSYTENGENTATFTDKISWDVKSSGYSQVITAKGTTRTFNLKYRVRLINETEGFVDENTYATNGRTYVDYIFSNGTEGELDFVIPSVKGYLKPLELTIVDEDTGEVVEGASFTLVHKEACPECGGEVVIKTLSATTDENGKLVFPAVPSGHEYTLLEPGVAPGYIPNDKTYDIKVEYRKSYIENTEITPDSEVTNKAYAPATISIEGSKKLSGGDKADADIRKGQFEFNIENNYTKGVKDIPATAETAAGGAIDFGKWTFTIPGNYSFTITENDLNSAGYSYDNSSYTVNVTVFVAARGDSLEAVYSILKNGEAAQKIEFANSYTAPNAITSDKLDGKVTLTENGKDKDIKNNQFNITVKASPENDTKGFEAQLPSTVPVSSEGSFELPEIKFIKPGTYSFVVTEDDNKAAGYEYDTSELVVTYKVTLDEINNTLFVAETSITENGMPVEKLLFENKYATPDPVELPVDGVTTLTGGGKTNNDIIDGLFSYTVTGGDASGVENVLATAEVEEGGAIDFGTWKFTEEGTYTFKVKENTPPAGYTDVTGEVTVTVTVTLNEETNKLEAVATFSSGEILKIDNTYVAPDPIKAVIDGSKTLTENGKEIAITANRFFINIVADASNDTSGYTFTPSAVAVGTDGKFKFNEISFLKAGTYKFNITEDDKGAAGYHYDGAIYAVTYTVTLNTDTNILVLNKTEITRDGEPVSDILFRNIYDTPAPAELSVDGVTTLTGGGKTNDDITEDLFSYTVTGNDQDNVLDVPAEILTESYGALDFGTWKFTEEGTYTFKVKENTPPAGYTDETGEVTVTVTVTLNEETNKLEAVATFSSGEILKIDNTYVAPAPISLSLIGEVTLDGQKTNSDIADGDFTFKVWADENNNPEGFEGFAEDASAKAGGAIDFSSATFTKDGIYQFAITQNNLNKTGYIYDDSVTYITVTVTLDKETNTLSYKTAMIKNNENVDGVVFNNIYEPIPVSDELIFGKNIIGIPVLSANFSFVLKADNAEYPMPQGSANGEIIASVTGEGEVSFGKITFTEPGEYSYTVYEVNDKTLGYIYDRTVYEITYTVTDADGILESKRVIMADGEIVDETVFKNVYIPPILPIIPIIPVFPIIPILPVVPEIPDFSDDSDKPTTESNSGDADNGNSDVTDEEIPYTGSLDTGFIYIVLFAMFISAGVVLFLRKKATI